jgi:hypothetical protein
MGIIYHSNGKEAWRGSPGDIVYHDNGKEAWRGELGDIVYHWNGKEAWRGRPGDIVYHDNGKELTRGGTSCQVNIGSGFLLTVTTTEATLLVNGTNIVIAKYKPKPSKKCDNCSQSYHNRGYHSRLRYANGHGLYNFCSSECGHDFIASDDYEMVNENNLTKEEQEEENSKPASSESWKKLLKKFKEQEEREREQRRMREKESQEKESKGLDNMIDLWFSKIEKGINSFFDRFTK